MKVTSYQNKRHNLVKETTSKTKLNH